MDDKITSLDSAISSWREAIKRIESKRFNIKTEANIPAATDQLKSAYHSANILSGAVVTAAAVAGVGFVWWRSRQSTNWRARIDDPRTRDEQTISR